MSASSKKKLRNELNAAKMTERQLAEQKEAKKLKLLTLSFTAVLAVILVVAIVFASIQFVNTSGIFEKNTVAVTLGDTELSNAQLNYFYVDAAFEYANTYGAYASIFGLDFTKPLDQQVINEETGETWADEFVTYAINNAKSTYALCAEAEANGYTLSEDTMEQIDMDIANFETLAPLYGFADADEYIRSFYGRGASVKSFREYRIMSELAQEYSNFYTSNLTYEEPALRAAEEGKEIEFNSYSYHYYYLNSSKFLTGGTTDADGNTTYSDEERATALKAAEDAAKALAEGEFASAEDFDAAIAALEVNADAETAPKSTACEDYAYTNLTTVLKDWVSDSSRTPGELGIVENVSTTTNDDGTETKTVNGYYVVYFVECNDNIFPLVNVRHILIEAEGGKTDPNTGATTYSEEELAAAKEKAEELLKQWKNGDANEESFAALATEFTADPGSKETGGLYEDIAPGQMVPSFNDWCFDESRKPGDTGIVESDYGYHIMYFSGDSETTFRDYLIKNYLINTDSQNWYNGLLEALVATEGDTKYLSRDLVLSGSN